jgi:hypothetical protein
VLAAPPSSGRGLSTPPAVSVQAGLFTLMPPRRLGALVQARAALPERPPKDRA